MSSDATVRVQAQALTEFTAQAFQKLNVSEEDAHIAANVLVAADLRGISSHGVAHLRRYIDGIRHGLIVARPQEQVITETPSTATMDAGNGLGQPAGYRAMQRAIRKAREVGVGFCRVRRSNHYGIAAYYAMMALEHDCIGLSLTNASPLVLPTFGSRPAVGTNPISIAVPAGQARSYVLDMATSTVALGKYEIAERMGKSVPTGWAVDVDGTPLTDAHETMDKFRQRTGVGLLPLGGEGDLRGGHKGYGLGVWVDVMCGVLSGAGYSNLIGQRGLDNQPAAANVGHFFGAWRIDAFRPVDEFKAAMDDLQQRLKNAPKVEGQERIYIAGEKEYEAAERHLRDGIPLDPQMAADLKAIAQELEVEYDLE
jgi:LDH2 family malate/lactate/ureidoglycolate dehydrogenase